MLHLVYFDGYYVGSVHARDIPHALLRADERFGPFVGGTVEARPASDLVIPTQEARWCTGLERPSSVPPAALP